MTTENASSAAGKDGHGNIEVSKDGPYLVSGSLPLGVESIVEDGGGTPLNWRGDKKYLRAESYRLCRCGKSKSKPFCDDTHLKTRFNGTETASRAAYLKQAQVIDGPALKLTDAQDLCSTASFCHRSGGIWSLVKKSDDPQARKIAIECAQNCPSGRLVVWDKKTGEPIEPEFAPSISVTQAPGRGISGPLWVKGGVPVKSADGKAYETRNRVTLCRCGKSSNKPFCDGTHATIEFKD